MSLKECYARFIKIDICQMHYEKRERVKKFHIINAYRAKWVNKHFNSFTILDCIVLCFVRAYALEIDCL